MSSEAESLGRVEGLRSRGGTLRSLLAVCPARIISRDRGALRHSDYDLLYDAPTTTSRSFSPQLTGGSALAGGADWAALWWIGSRPWDLRSWAATLRTV